MPRKFRSCLTDDDLEIGGCFGLLEEACEGAAGVIRQNEIVVADVLSSLRRHVFLAHLDFIDDLSDCKPERAGQFNLVPVILE